MINRSDFVKLSPEAAAHLTLRDVFQQYFLKRRKQLEANSIVSYESTIKRWEVITGNPTLGELSGESFDLEKFLQFVEEKMLCTRLDGRPGQLSLPSANKELRQLQAILALCGPGRKCLKIFRDAPELQLFDEPDPEPRIMTLEELSAIYHHCHVAAWPKNRGIAPESWWQASVVYLSNCGSRTSDWLSLKTENCNLNEQWVLIDAEKKTKKANKLPLPDCLVEHLQRIWGRRELVFPAPNNKTYRNNTFRAIQQAAGIPEPHFRIKDMRSTCGDRFYAVDAAAGQGVLNHGNRSTTDRNYVNPLEHKFRFLQRCLREIEQPAAFLGGQPQLRLFDGTGGHGTAGNSAQDYNEELPPTA